MCDNLMELLVGIDDQDSQQITDIPKLIEGLVGEEEHK